MRTPAALARLREIDRERLCLEEQRRRLDAEAVRLHDELLAESAPTESPAKAVASSFVGIKEIARALGLSYDAARMRVSRADVGRQFGNATYAPREWLDAQLATVRSVRSLSEQRDADL